MTDKKMPVLYVSVSDESRAQLVKAVLEYEAATRGLSRGQVLVQMLRDAAGLGDYPPEVLDRLAEIDAETRRRAIEASLTASKVA